MKTGNILLFALLAGLIACHNDDDSSPSTDQNNEKPPPGMAYPVYAGSAGTFMTQAEFDPPFKMVYEYDTDTNFYFGEDSLDLDLDGKYDLGVRVRFTEKNIPAINVDSNSYASILPKNGLEILFNSELCPLGLGVSYSYHWVDTLRYKDRIDDRHEMFEPAEGLPMWSLMRPMYECSQGCWVDVADRQLFIGIRKATDSTFKYGWIRVQVHSRIDFELVGYAMQQ